MNDNWIDPEKYLPGTDRSVFVKIEYLDSAGISQCGLITGSYRFGRWCFSLDVINVTVLRWTEITPVSDDFKENQEYQND